MLGPLSLWGYEEGSQEFVLVSWLDLNVPFEHRYGYIRDEGVCTGGLSERARYNVSGKRTGLEVCM